MTGQLPQFKALRIGIILLWLLFSSLVIAETATEKGMVTVMLEEVPVWKVDPGIVSSFTRGGYASIHSGALANVKYPQLKSETPQYGEVHLGGNGHHFVLDHSEGKAGTYDRLYFDADRDRDLSNESPSKALAVVPEVLLRTSSTIKEQILFEAVEVPFDFGSAGRRSVEMMLRMWVYEGRSPQLTFFPVGVHTGEFDVGGVSYTAFLGYGYSVEGRLDQASSALFIATDGDAPARWWGGDRLNATHLLGGRYYQFSCTPTGDKLFVRSYEGDLGTLEIGPGGRDVETLEIRGSLRGKDTAVAVADGMEGGWPEPTQKCEIPAGDYYPAYLTMRIGDVRISVSNNYHVDAKGRSRNDREVVHGIKIRAGKPYVLDFSNKPVVAFVQPKDKQRVTPGSEVKVEAVLLDPVLDIMIRRLDDMSRVEKKTYKTPDGQERTYERAPSLDPKVTVARTNGEIVAEGVMPFG
ncbi:MAG: hypothetical protein JW741_27855 [Sedimentisphaerales bacterium]|nr:hypothetical protein [Sedimentisphaerales bacterium]